ncbi:protein SYM1 [Dioscorea cayenensis subsp. rotundata]|uniref:Protein SYM1 n=1 Tax=Dioscorea cayennensis subsp. rotundata TaxID=55577 RepID=A0AB40D1W5_DIOCR|nr:protein SYM1 [Dioscorea cayenensis subsp. rotundata]
MSINLLRGGGGGGGQGAAVARRLLLRHLTRSPAPESLSRPFVRSRLFSNGLKESPVAPSLSVPSSRASSTTTRNAFVTWYLGRIEARPVLTKSLTAGAIFVAADISSQMITLESSDSLDLIRTIRMASYGMVLSGPSLHLWFNFVARIIPKRDLISTLKKLFIGQTVYGPIMTSIFFSSNAAAQGETSAEIYARLKRDLIPTLKSGLIYWPFCDFITFKFIPVRLQPLVSNSFSFLWTIYITYMASLEKAIVEEKSND